MFSEVEVRWADKREEARCALRPRNDYVSLKLAGNRVLDGLVLRLVRGATGIG